LLSLCPHVRLQLWDEEEEEEELYLRLETRKRVQRDEENSSRGRHHEQ
jgi:hypothetical protein